MAPENLRFTQSHEWVKVEGSKARIGLTDFAVREIKDVVYLDLPQPGAAVKAKTACGAVETVKAAFDLYSPVSGKVLASNADMVAHPEKVSADPFGASWLVELEVDPSVVAGELAGLMDAQAYSAHCARDGGH